MYQKFAELIVNHSLDVQMGDQVLVIATTEAKPLVLALQKEILKKGGFPNFQISFPEMNTISIEYGDGPQLSNPKPFDILAAREFDKLLLIHSESNPMALSRLSMAKQKLQMQSMAEPMQMMFTRVAKNEAIWASILFPTEGYAQSAGYDHESFEKLLFSVNHLYDENPLGFWQALEEKQELMIQALESKKSLKIVGEKTNLSMGIEGRKWINGSGRVNLPDGEIYSAPIEGTVEGQIYFKHSLFFKGNEIKGVTLWFEKGTCVKCHADKGQGYLETLINLDEGSNKVGEIAFGTNYEVSETVGNILFDEKMGGTVHIALGNAYYATGGTNKSSLHIDLICDLRVEGTVVVDDEIFLEKGRYKNF